jgi:hypothetical protein
MNGFLQIRAISPGSSLTKSAESADFSFQVPVCHLTGSDLLSLNEAAL